MPHNVVSVSGGKESTALLILAIVQEVPNLQAVFAATLSNIEAFVACDASAISSLSLGEHRTALLKMLRQARATTTEKE